MHLESRHLQIYKAVKTRLLQCTFMFDFKHFLECFQRNPVVWSCSKKLTSNKIKLTGSILFAQTKKFHDVENSKISLSPPPTLSLSPSSLPPSHFKVCFNPLNPYSENKTKIYVA